MPLRGIVVTMEPGRGTERQLCVRCAIDGLRPMRLGRSPAL